MMYLSFVSKIIIYYFITNFKARSKKKIMEYPEKYASVHQLVNMPKKRHLIYGEDIFIRSEASDLQNKYVSNDIKKSRNQLIENIEKQLQIFQDTEYNFKFPESKFPQVPKGETNQISYQQKIEVDEQDTFNPKLSIEQLKQMKQNATFQVKSGLHNATIPYVWQVNDWLLRGRLNIIRVWQNGLAFIYSLFMSALITFVTVIPESLGKIVKLPRKFFSIVFGKKSIQSFYTPDYQKQVEKDFWTDIMQNQLKDITNQIGHNFLQLLYLQYQPAVHEVIDRTGKTEQQFKKLNKIRQQKISQYYEKRSKLNKFKMDLQEVQSKFQANWVKIRKRILMKVSAQMEEVTEKSIPQSDDEPLNSQLTNKKDQAILDKFHQQKFLIYIAHLKKHLPKLNMSTQAIQSLIVLITLISIIQIKIDKKNQRLAQLSTNTRDSIMKKHSIRSKDHRFLANKMKQLYDPVKNRIQTEFYDHLFEDLSIRQHLNSSYQSIYIKYLNLKKNLNALIDQKKANLKCLYKPTRVFKTTYMLLPPYQVQNNNGYYSLKRIEVMTTDTSTHFWKFKLYAMRMKSWTINCAIFLLGFAWVGPFGLRCLFGANDFAYDETIDYTGLKTKIYRTTVLGVFKKVLVGIKKSRQNFEALPDRGLFGKNFSRIFNIIQCYVFRLLLVGVIGVLLLYPITILVLSLLCIVLVVTTWIWVPLVMLVTYLFNILIFQFESSTQTSGILIKSVPLVSLVLFILFYLITSISAILFLLIIAPVISLLYFLLLIIQRGWRTFTDSLMLCIIGTLGRTPSRDTAIARKISGPGMSRNYFFSIFEDDVYILTQCALQKILMKKFQQLTSKKIQQNSKKYEQIIDYVMSAFGYLRLSLSYDRDIVNRNIQKLQNTFDDKYQTYMARYPNYPTNIRFTQQQIDSYFGNCVKIVKNFVEKTRIKEWVFEEKQILHEDYDELTRSIWMQIFRCSQEIFEPLQKIDSRFKLEDQQNSNHQMMRRNVQSVMKALEGEVKLSYDRANFNPAKTSLLEKDRYIGCIYSIYQIHSDNSEKNLNLFKTDVTTLFVPPRNLEDLKSYDEYNNKNVYAANINTKLIQL